MAGAPHEREGRRVFAGIELGGTKTVCAVGTGPGRVEARAEFATQDPEPTLREIAAFLSFFVLLGFLNWHFIVASLPYGPAYSLSGWFQLRISPVELLGFADGGTIGASSTRTPGAGCTSKMSVPLCAKAHALPHV